jgi:hypothetical protein
MKNNFNTVTQSELSDLIVEFNEITKNQVNNETHVVIFGGQNDKVVSEIKKIKGVKYAEGRSLLKGMMSILRFIPAISIIAIISKGFEILAIQIIRNLCNDISIIGLYSIPTEWTKDFVEAFKNEEIHNFLTRNGTVCFIEFDPAVEPAVARIKFLDSTRNCNGSQ